MAIKQATGPQKSLKCPLVWVIISATLLITSLTYDFQYELIKEHTRFRKGFPTRTVWEKPPDGNLNCYVFNMTNTEAFLNGTDKKLKLQQIGPLVYRIKAVNLIYEVNHEESTMTYRKVRYQSLTFDEKNSEPGILNRQIFVPNVALLSVAAKMHDWFVLTRNAFNVYTQKEPLFIQTTIQDYLWNFTTPLIDNVKSYLPVMKNIGMLHNAMREKVEVFKVNIGTKNGLENFFKIQSLNNNTVFSTHFNKYRTDPENCPVHVLNSFDNTLFPPYLTREHRLSLVAGDACRILPLVYDSDVSELGHKGYKFIVPNDNEKSCLRSSMGIQLPNGVFDVANCVVEYPAANSHPHFFNTSYNYEEHFEGLSPNAADHQTYLLIEPTTGIPFEEKYRFQTNIPIPHLSGFSQNIRRFNGMILPMFWYEYDLDDLPTLGDMMLKFTAYYSPYFQKFCIVLSIFGALLSLKIILCRLFGPIKEWRFLRNEMKQTISEAPNSGGYYEDSNSFLPKDPSKFNKERY